MGPQTPDPSHLYSQAIQLKLYQSFIFSVPILFFIILLLLFYLFYLKRRRESILSSTPAAALSWRLNQTTTLVPLPHELGLKKELKEELQVIAFDEKICMKESQCCVCLGDFELKEQLHQIPSCKHVFHIDCIHHWLQSNFTCPLCRCTIISTKKQSSEASIQVDLIEQSELNTNYHPHRHSVSDQQLVDERSRESGNQDSCSSGESSGRTEGSSLGREHSTATGDSLVDERSRESWNQGSFSSGESSGRTEGSSIGREHSTATGDSFTDSPTDFSLHGSVAIQIQMNNS